MNGKVLILSGASKAVFTAEAVPRSRQEQEFMQFHKEQQTTWMGLKSRL